MNTKFKRPKFTTEFKQGAVKLVTEQGYTRQAAAASLGVSLSAITRWVQAENGTQARPGTKQEGLNLSERNELEILRKENAKLLMEKEILKKAAVFFAKESE
ncbi:transposase [Moritella viscosa]|uniref:Transposase IS3/IS911 family protein n=1 Tax=Moritella viscosa TaxID=80854 RepID=A0ABY1H9R4_9GAMM|nr:transposase [Moritella viscosa]SGY87174.1 Transposase IS3/IS911 family protein [Moritella viscosa]SHO25134.1 Transposase IS3/IS911 family protein [Moritella viscosa]